MRTRGTEQMYVRQPTGLAPDSVAFGGGGLDFSIANGKNIQRPETVETLFYLWRATGDQKYRDQGWAIFKARSRVQLCRIPQCPASVLKCCALHIGLLNIFIFVNYMCACKYGWKLSSNSTPVTSWAMSCALASEYAAPQVYACIFTV